MDDSGNEQPKAKKMSSALIKDKSTEVHANPEYKPRADQHEKVQHWTDTLYSLAKKGIVVILGIIFLFDIVRPREDSTIEIITELYRLSLEQGRMEFLAPAVAIFFLARNLPIFVKGMREMFKDS